uniref:Mediator of RNA polymerase II transcription subunit 5 n=1 Tax=Mesocestoides corti TaxID=53468 RepID=A0A5K3FVW7_MESCO
MLWAAQTPLSSQEMSLVLKHLISSTLTPEKGGEKEAVSMPLNHGSIHLIMALLFSLEPFGTPGINVDQYADADEQDLLHPIFSEAGYVATVTELFTQVGVADQPPSAAVEGLYGLLQLAWGIALRRTTHLRMDLRRRGDNASGTNVNANGDSVDEDDLVASALRSRTIEFLSVGLLSEPHFPQEPQWVHRVHNLLTELLIQFPQNVRDIRLWDESVARRVGVDPGGFAILLDAIGRLYNVPGSPLHARLSLEYWWPAGETVVAPSEALNASFRAGEVENSRQAILFRFVYSASEFASSPLIFVSYVRILRSLVGCQTSSNLCFNLLKATASSGGRLASLLTWDHFITSLQQYLEHLKRAAAVEPDTGSQPLHLQHPHLYYSMGGQSQRDQKQQASPVPLEIQPEELEALQIVAALITRVAALDPVARSAFATNTKWCLIPTAVGLITCPLPMSMKAELLHLLSALSRTPTIAAEVWRNLWESRLLSFIEPSSNLAVSGSLASLRSVVGLHTEIDKAEARVEEYPITLGFINLLTTLAPSLLNCPATVTGSESPTPATDTGESMSRLVHFTIETVFLKHTMRAYRRPNERWEIAASCVVLFEGLVRTFLHRMHSVAILSAGASRCSDAQLATFDWTPLLNGQVNLAKLTLPRGWPFTDPGYQIVAQLLTNSSLFCLLTDLLEVGLYRLLEYSVNASSCAMARTTAAILRLFDQILPHEQMVVNLVRRAALVMPHLRPETAWGQRSGASVILPSLLSRLLVVTINSRTGRADLLVTIVRYCGLSDDLPDHCTSALNILCSVVRAVQPHDSVLAVFTSDKKTEQDLLRALVSCLSTSMEDLPDTSGVESVPIFSDAWLNTDTAGDIAGVDSGSWRGPLQPHPSLKVARTLAAFPIMPSDWDMAEARWEAMAAFPPSSLSETTGVSREADVIQVLCHGPQGHGSSVRSMILHLILFALTHHPSPSIAHWLLGFRSKNARSIAITTLQV